MPLPAIVAGAASVLAAAIVLDDLLTGGRVSDLVGKKAAQAVLDARGIPLDLDGEVNQLTITQAINAAVMPEGVEFENIFDKLAIGRDIKKMALAQAGQAFGFEGSIEPKYLKRQIVDQITREVSEQIKQGGGEYIEAARGLVAADRLINQPEPFNWQAPRVFTQKAEKNRERQARWRAANNRVWVTK